MSDDLRCDFCGSGHPRWEYRSSDFDVVTVDGATYRSTGAWLACRECGDLIEAGWWERLVGRSIEQIAERFDTDRDAFALLMADPLSTTYASFQANRYGKRRLV